MLFQNSFAILIACVFSLALPIGLMVWWKKKTGEKIWSFIVGAICFCLFAMVLERILHQLCLVNENAVSKTITASPVLYTLYAAFAAGIFEETGRLFGFNVLLRKHSNNECSVAYGIGHGGIEVLMLLGINYFILLLALLGVNFGSEAANSQMLETVKAVTVSGAFIGMLERISAMMIHIGLSMLVFAAAREKSLFWLYPTAVLLHALADAPAALYQYGIIKSLFAVEASAFVLGILCLIFGINVLRKRGGFAKAEETESE